MDPIQKERLYRRAYTRMDNKLRGPNGGSDMFGWWDWSTLRYVSPSWYKTLKLIMAMSVLLVVGCGPSPGSYEYWRNELRAELAARLIAADDLLKASPETADLKVLTGILQGDIPDQHFTRTYDSYSIDQAISAMRECNYFVGHPIANSKWFRLRTLSPYYIKTDADPKQPRVYTQSEYMELVGLLTDVVK